MLAKLLESKAEGDRFVWGVIISAIAHTAGIALAVVATAQARIDEPGDVEIVRWINPPVPSAPATAAHVEPADRPALAPLPDLRVLDKISVVTPSVDPIAGLAGLTSVPMTDRSAMSGLMADKGGRVATGEPLTADQVERQVSLRRGSPAPRYPDPLRSQGVEGQVVALFVVNERGRAEPGTLRFTRSDNPLFEAAVREALSTLQFVPAEVAGRKVRQLVQMPFVFRLSR